MAIHAVLGDGSAGADGCAPQVHAGVDAASVVGAPYRSAVAALGASRPGRPGQWGAEASRAAALQAEVERLGRTVVELAVELAVL